MALQNTSFSNLINFSRGTGKTYVNSSGLIVGVDFSSTSNTITTGSKTFTLAADLNVNRDWAVGSNVRAVDQVGGGAMVGTVTSYTPSTQSLVINVASVTGSGTSTNWRIGSLEMTRDALTGGVSSEPAATNLLTFSEQFENAVWTKTNATVSSNVTLSPDGSANADKLVEDATNNTHQITAGAGPVANNVYTASIFAKAGEREFLDIAGMGFTGQGKSATFNLRLGTVAVTGGAIASITPAANGFYRCSITTLATNTNPPIYSINVNGSNTYTGDGTSGIFIWGAQLELNAPTSYIPTTTAQVTRAADSFALSSTAINSIRQGQGTLYVEAESADVGPTQKRAIRLSGLTGDIRLAKRGVGNFSGFTKMLEVDNDLYFGTTAGNSQRDNGKEIGSFSVVADKRNNLPVTIGAFTALAYDGNSQILNAVSNGEFSFTKNLSLNTLLGFSGTQINGGTYTGTRFIFSSGTAGRIYVSQDGITYRSVETPVITLPTNDVTSGLVAGQTRVVIVGNQGFLATSDDQGETWTSRTSGVGVALVAVAQFNGRFVAVSDNPGSSRYSDNGITWNAVTGLAANIQDVAHNGTNLWVAVGATGAIYTSADGITWTVRTSGVTATLGGVHFANGLWVAVGTTGTILTSPDGITWTPQTSGTTSTLTEVNYFNNTWIAVGGAQTLITSPNATTWTSRTSNISGAFFGIAASPTRVVIVGSNGAVTTSEDAITYTSRTNNAAGINGMAFGNGVFVSVGNSQGGSGYIATIDGAGNYTRRVSGVNTTLLNVRFFNGAFFAAAASDVNSVLRSTDGSSWSVVASLGSGGGTTYDVAYSGSIFVAVTAAGRFAVSTNGLTWPTVVTNTGVTTQNLQSVFFANGIFVAVGHIGHIITGVQSGNTVVWTLRTSGTTQNLQSVMYSTRDQLWYAAGAAGTLLFSADAITWQSVQNAGFASIDNTGLQVNPMLPLWVNGKNKIALSYNENAVVVSQNGVSKTDLTATIPNITSGVIGENLNGLIYKVELLSKNKNESQLNTMTTI